MIIHMEKMSWLIMYILVMVGKLKPSLGNYEMGFYSNKTTIQGMKLLFLKKHFHIEISIQNALFGAHV